MRERERERERERKRESEILNKVLAGGNFKINTKLVKKLQFLA